MFRVFAVLFSCLSLCLFAKGEAVVGVNSELKPSFEIVPTPRELKVKGAAEYQIVFKNFPVGQELVFASARLVEGRPKLIDGKPQFETHNPDKFTNHEKFMLREDGVIVLNGESEVSAYCLSSKGYLPGERVRCRFLSKEGRVVAEASYVPKPIRAKSAKGTFEIEAELIAFNPLNYKLIYHGVEENESLHVVSVSKERKSEKDVKFVVNSLINHCPETSGGLGGKDTIEVSRKTGDNVVLNLLWGTHLISEFKK